MKVYTERVTYFQDNDGFVVRHVFRTDEDDRRYTVFHPCRNEFQAQSLVVAIGGNLNET